MVVTILAYQNCIEIRDENKWHVSKFWYSKRVSFEPIFNSECFEECIYTVVGKIKRTLWSNMKMNKLMYLIIDINLTNLADHW